MEAVAACWKSVVFSCFTQHYSCVLLPRLMTSLLNVQSTPERRLVETGRVALCNYGKFCGKLVVIVNVIDGRRVLVDGPSEKSKITRQVQSPTVNSLLGRIPDSVQGVMPKEMCLAKMLQATREHIFAHVVEIQPGQAWQAFLEAE
jgi:hypothetical protein